MLTEAAATPHATVRMVGKATSLWNKKRASFLRLCQKYEQLFNISDKSTSNFTDFKMEPPQIVTPTSTPPKQLKREIAAKVVRGGIKEKILVPSQSEWSSPVVLVPKSKGKCRLCVNYRP